MIALKYDANGPVLEMMIDDLGRLGGSIAAPVDRPRFTSVLHSQFAPVYAALGPEKKSDSIDAQQRRALLFGLLGGAKDPAIVAEADRIADRVYPSTGKPDTSIDPALAQAAVEVAAANATDSSLYDRVFAVSGDGSDPNRQSDSLSLLSHFNAPPLVARTLDLAASGQVRKQDVWRLFAGSLANRDTQDQAWTWMRANWDKVQSQLTPFNGSRVVSATGFFCTTERQQEVSTFFAAHPVNAAARALPQAVDSIGSCARLRAAQNPNLLQWLAQKTDQPRTSSLR